MYGTTKQASNKFLGPKMFKQVLPNTVWKSTQKRDQNF